MGTILKRKGKKGTTYSAQVRLAEGSKFATFVKRADALDWIRTQEADIKRGAYLPHKRRGARTLADVIKEYRKSPDYAKLAPSELRNRVRQLDWWEDEYGKKPLSQLAEILPAARDRLHEGGRSGTTCNRYLGAISKALSYARRELKWLDHNPATGVSRFALPDGRAPELADAQRDALLKACKASRDADLYPLVLVALSTAARQGELLALTWPDVNLRTGVLTFRNTKNGTTRAVPLSGPALELLRSRSKVRKTDKPLVFPRNCDGAWRTARKAAGLPGFRFHDLRHASASYLAMSGATLRELADVLGHKTLAMVRRYSHLTEQHTAEIMRRMVATHIVA